MQLNADTWALVGQFLCAKYWFPRGSTSIPLAKTCRVLWELFGRPYMQHHWTLCYLNRMGVSRMNARSLILEAVHPSVHDICCLAQQNIPATAALPLDRYARAASVLYPAYRHHGVFAASPEQCYWGLAHIPQGSMADSIIVLRACVYLIYHRPGEYWVTQRQLDSTTYRQGHIESLFAEAKLEGII